jgi:hypothetical protein
MALETITVVESGVSVITITDETAERIAVTTLEPAVTLQITTAGEVNTGRNLGTGHQLFAGKTGPFLDFRTLVAGTGISATTTDTLITLEIDGSEFTTDTVPEGTLNLYWTTDRFDTRLATKSTTDIAEGTNLYWTLTRFNSAFTSKSTTDLTEGTNLYYTPARFDSRLATKTTTDLAEGSNLYYTDARVGSYLAANNYATTGDITTAITELVDSAPAALDTLNELAAALGDDANFSTTISTLIGLKLDTSDFDSTANTWLATRTTSNLAEGSNLYWTTSRFDTRLATKSTTDIAEGTNLYYTQTRFDQAFGAKTTTDLTEGTNLYYTTARADSDFDTRLATKSTTDLAEGTNLYYTTARANSAIDARVTASYINNLTGVDCDSLGGQLPSYYLNYNNLTNQPAIPADVSDLTDTTGLLATDDLSNNDTDDLAEGTANLYYTDLRVTALLESGSVTEINWNSGAATVDWNSNDGTLNVNYANGVALQLGQETHFYAKATEPISNGSVVMFAGAQGAHMLVRKADASLPGFRPEYIVGVATQTFTTNEYGYVTTFGKVRELNTSAYNEGDILYFNPSVAGGLTTTEPTGSHVQMAAVLRSHVTQGIILVRPTIRLATDGIPEGTTNLYWTTDRFDTQLATKTTDDLAAGTTNKYYSTTLANSDIDARVTGSFIEGLNFSADGGSY